MGSLFFLSLWVIFRIKKTKWITTLIAIFWFLYALLFLGMLKWILFIIKELFR
jgi:hypothetical protein